MSKDHPILCEHCARGTVAYRDEMLFESPHRLSEAHIGVRFPGQDYKGHIYLDDKELKDCIEALAGENGFALVIILSRPPAWSACSFCKRPTKWGYTVLRGNVSYVRS